ncbi:MAG: hypothetical protein AAF197_06490 [Pseudomonadota bacterium]
MINSRIVLVVATHAEAQPLIQHFKMQPECSKPFALYIGGAGSAETSSATDGRSISLLVTGLGSPNAMMAVSWCAGYLPDPMIWLNVGVAGGGDKDIGDLYWVNKVEGIPLTRAVYPFALIKSTLATDSIRTLEKPSHEYEEGLFDMESAGFFAAATKFARFEFVQALKIVSDNSRQSLAALDKQLISSLISSNINQIDDFVTKLVACSAIEGEQEVLSVFNNLRCTKSQERLINEALRKLALFGADHEETERTIQDAQSAKDLLHDLQDKVAGLAPSY